MKMQKLDQKQVPQVVGLGVISVGVFGYALFNFVLSAPKAPAAPAGDATVAAATSTSPTSSTSSTAAGANAAEAPPPGTPGAAGVQVVQNTPSSLQLPGQYNPDPFRSSLKAEVPVTIAPKPQPKPEVEKKATPLPDANPGRKGEGPGAAQPALAQPKPVVLPPARPEIVVRGTSVVEGMNLAILEIGQEHRVVQVGDVLAKGFRVKKIKLEGVVVGEGKGTFFVPVGAKSEPKKPDNAEGSAAQS